MQLSGRGPARRPTRRIARGGPQRVPQPEPAPHRARLRRLCNWELRVLGGDRDLRLPPGRRSGRRNRHGCPADGRGRGGAVRCIPLGPVPPGARDAGLRCGPHRLHRRHRRPRRERRAEVLGLRARGRRVRLRRGLPSGRGVARPTCRTIAAGADRGQCGRELVRQHRRLRRPCARGVPDRVLGLHGGLRRDRCDVRVGARSSSCGSPPATRVQRPARRRTKASATQAVCGRCSTAFARSPTSLACAF